MEQALIYTGTSGAQQLLPFTQSSVQSFKGCSTLFSIKFRVSPDSAEHHEVRVSPFLQPAKVSQRSSPALQPTQAGVINKLADDAFHHLIQDPALGLVESHTIGLSPSIQPVQIPLQSLATLQQTNTSAQLGMPAAFPDYEQGGHEPSGGTWLKPGHRAAPNFATVPAAPGSYHRSPPHGQFPAEPPRPPPARSGLSPPLFPGPAARGSRHPLSPQPPAVLTSATCRLLTSALRLLPPPPLRSPRLPTAPRRPRSRLPARPPRVARRCRRPDVRSLQASPAAGFPSSCPPAAPARTSPSAAGTHRLLTGALPGPPRRLRARHSDLPCAQRPLLSPAPLRVRRPLECPLQWEPRGQPGLSLSPPGPPAWARRCGCCRLATPLFAGGGSADSCCRQRSAGPDGRSASSPPASRASCSRPGPQPRLAPSFSDCGQQPAAAAAQVQAADPETHRRPRPAGLRREADPPRRGRERGGDGAERAGTRGLGGGRGGRMRRAGGGRRHRGR
ncbi:proline-rich protein 36-like [Corvus kubaryi]|uniref:proline-rich protein 36-like n=1 Tax=Corvus kubaryi TaxID=68294 RepID=UPI001C03AB97|nr:proline-rich protein 36-like [Corvus kubaryi]